MVPDMSQTPGIVEGFLRLTRALSRSYTRNRQSIFWTLFFPVLLMVVFGLIGNSRSFGVRVVVAGPSSVLREAIIGGLRHGSVFSVRTASAAAAIAAVRHGDADVALILPATHGHSPIRIRGVYNSSNFIAAQQSLSAVQLAMAEIDLRLTGRPPALQVEPQPVAGRTTTYLSFLVPGILALMAMQNALFGLGAAIVRWKERGVLRRFFATPLPPGVFLAASLVNQLVIGLVSLAIVAFIGKDILHAGVLLPLLPLGSTLALGIATFLALAFLVAALAKTTESLAPIINLISFPMMFLSGIWFPVSSLPAVLRHIVAYLPLTFLADATRRLMSTTPTFTPAVRADLIGLAVWLVVAALVAARTWRWE